MTAHDLASDWSWMNTAIGFRIVGGRRVWEQAEYGEKSRGAVRLSRVAVTSRGLRTHKRYVLPTTPVELVPAPNIAINGVQP